MSARVLRGGSWNNNQDNARSEYRNNNQPDNRNNNSGFRVVVSSHIQPRLFNVERVARTMVRAMGRRDVGWRGCVLSARSKAASGTYKRRAPPELRLRGVRLFLRAGLFSGLANPASQKLADFGEHSARVLILAVGEPAPPMGQAQIQAQLV